MSLPTTDKKVIYKYLLMNNNEETWEKLPYFTAKKTAYREAAFTLGKVA